MFKVFFTKFVLRNPTRIWDQFAQPNNLNNTGCSFHSKSGLITPWRDLAQKAG